MSEERILHGIPVSAGTAVGPLVRVTPAPTALADEAPGDPAVEAERVRQALQQVADGLTARIANADDHAKAVLEATVMMAQDPGLYGSIEAKLPTTGTTNAVHDAAEEFAAMFEAMGGYMAERVTDIRDVRDRTIARLLGVSEPGVPSFEVPSVLTAVDLAPAETATLTPDKVLGIITEAGGPTSHTAILAAQLGIPAVVRTPGIAEVSEGTVVAFDGGVGEVIIAPTEDEVEQLAERRRRRIAALGDGSGAGVTEDGHPVALVANIGTVADAEKVGPMDVEGVGLFRTEFMFLERDTPPSLEEQTEAYTKVLQSFGKRRVVVRTMDAGADKPLAFADLGEEENPALGIRGIRLNMVRTDLIDTQLEALAAAYKACPDSDLRVMAPMIATVPETQWFVERAKALGLPSVGVMIEIPAAALRSKDILSIADFASLGTNDLGQYTMAADRMQGELSELLNPWQPALLDVIAAACEGGEATGKKVGVCGESAGNPALALVLVGLGVSSLSMAANKVPAVRTALSKHKMIACQRLAKLARAAATAEEARQVVLDNAEPIILDLV